MTVARSPVVAINTLSVSDASAGTRTMLQSLLLALSRVAPEFHQLLICSRTNRHLFEGRTEVLEVALAASKASRRIYYDQLGIPRLLKGRADVLVTPSSVASYWSPVPQVVVVSAHLVLPSCQRLAGRTYLNPLHRIYYGPMLRWSLRRADTVLAISDFLARGLVEELEVDASKVRAMPLGVRPPNRDVAVREHEPLILFVGTLFRYKDAMVALRAFLDAEPLLPQSTRLAIVGRDPDGKQAPALHEAARRAGMESRVDILGSIDDVALENLYQRAAVLIMPSRCEGFGLPVAEAMIHGVPVVVSDSTSLPEVAAGAGILVPPGQVGGFAHALVEVLSDGDRHSSLVERGLARAQELTWDAAARRLRTAVLEVTR